MKIKRAIVKEIISNLAVFSLPFSIINVVFFIAYGRTNPVLWVLVVPFLFMFAIRKRVKDIYAFVTAHVLLATVFGLIFWNYDARWFIVTFFVATGLFSCYLKTREEISLEKAFSATLIILFTGLFFLLAFAQATPEPMQVQLIFMFLTAKCLSILFTHMDNVDYRVNVLAKVNGFKDPTGKIISINNALIMVFAGGVFIVGLLVAFGTNLLRYINLLGDVIVGLFRRFSEVLVRTMNYADIAGERFMQETAPEYLHIYTQIYMQLQAEHLEDVQHDQYALFESLQRTFNILSVFIFAAILVFLVWRFYKYFHKKREKAWEEDTTDTVVNLDKTVVSDLMDLLPRFKTKLRNPIRRAYAKKINRHIRAGIEINNSDTTDIIAGKIRSTENIDELTAKYERVRYGK